MAKDFISLGDVAARVAMIDIRCSRCDRHGRLSVQRLLAEHGADAATTDIIRAQIGARPNRARQQAAREAVP